MKYSEARPGRIFVIRLEDGDVVHEAIEAFAASHDIRAGALVVVGGADHGSRLVVGPQEGRSAPVTPMQAVLENVHEVAGTGTIFPDAEGTPRLHMHMACGRNENTVTGCVRAGVCVWHVMEAVLFELTQSRAVRQWDS
ncbi:MAG: PPC domain-containing DNA-binding protein, partial [Thermodesulfobacteriota bacterium]